MKRIILCEGKNDRIFLSELLSSKSNEVSTIEKKEIRRKEESKVIRDFLDDPYFYGNKSYLIKCECGKGDVKIYFKKFFRQFGSYPHCLILCGIIDVDKSTEKHIFEEMDRFLLSQRIELDKIQNKQHIILTDSERIEHILFVVPTKDLEWWVEKHFGKVTEENIRKLAKMNIEWILELKGILHRKSLSAVAHKTR